MKIKFLFPLILCLTGIYIHQSGEADFPINIHKSNQVVVIEWEKNAEEKIKEYRIYISEGEQPNFPQTLVAELDGGASYWVSKERKTLPLFDDLFGLDLRDYSQWRDQEVLTPGEIYTVGVEKVFLDNTSQMSNPSVIIPCENKTIKIEELPALPRVVINVGDYASLRNEVFDSSYIEKKAGGMVLNLFGTSYFVDSIEEGPEFYYLYTQTEIVKCEKMPNRPTIYGDTSLIFIILKFQLFCLIVIAFYFLFITTKAVHYLNFLALDSNDPKEVIKMIIHQESSSVFIIYFIVLIAKNYFSNKLIQIIISEICSNNHQLINTIAEIFNTHKIYQFSQIKTSILSIVA